MLSPFRPGRSPSVILKQVHFRQPALQKRTLLSYLARKKLKLAWFMNHVLTPFINEIEQGRDPLPEHGRSLNDEESVAAA